MMDEERVSLRCGTRDPRTSVSDGSAPYRIMPMHTYVRVLVQANLLLGIAQSAD